MDDGMEVNELSAEEIELNRRAFPMTADVDFSFNFKNNVGVKSPINSVSNLTNEGKISMPQHVDVQEVRSSEFSQILNSNPSLDGKTSMPQTVDELRSPKNSQQFVSNLFSSSSFGKISMPKNAFEEQKQFG